MLNIYQKKALDKRFELSFQIIFTRFLKAFALLLHDHLLFLLIRCMNKASSKIYSTPLLKKWIILMKQMNNIQKIFIF